MIDTHCHLLPGLDDGPPSVEESLELATSLVTAGVREVLCTPHFSRRYPTDHDMAREALAQLVEALATAGLPLRLKLAAEIGSAAAVEAPAEALRLRRAGSDHLLVELEADTPAGVVDLAVSRLATIGLTPVFAHPERCRAVRSQPRVLDAARDRGALVQVVVPSLSGRWGDGASGSAWGLLESGRADLLATDCHRARQGGERLAGALAAVERRLGRSRLEALTETNPKRLIGSSPEVG